MGDVTTLSLVELGVLGPLQVRQYGLPVAVPGAKPRAVLTMLGLHGGSVVTADALAELLWGPRPPRTAVKALQTHISSLRRALGDGYVLTEGTGWTLSTTEIDATRYKLAARQGRDAFAGGDAGQAVARFDEALALWRGAPELPDGPRGGSEKTRWIESHAALVEDRVDALLATGRAAEIVGELEAAIADAPLRERRWSQLMLALYRAGRQGEALAAYQRARSMLADELGVDPGPDLRRLEAAIVAQDVALEIAVPEQLSIVTRAVTFLLTDIEGSTAAWEADAEAMATALARHDEIVEQVVTSRGGRLVKTRGEGDATFSVFDRPSGAAAAAIELQEAIRHEPWVLAEPMRIRVALHTGEVELRDGDYFGRAVNRAARLRSLAAGGQTLCSGATAELVIDTLSDDVVLADLGMRQLRNLARPEHVFELRLETAVDSVEPAVETPIERPALPAVLAGPGPFVGRVPELEGLLAEWESTLAAGARAVLISGEPGVGKTRLAGEWSRLAYEQGAVVLYGRCDEDLGAAYQPFAEALRSLVPCLGADRLRAMRGIEALLLLVPRLTDTVPDLTTPTRSDPDTERYALFDAVVALLAMAAASAPVVLILDDLHWAAKPTLLLLRHLLRFGEHARVQIVGTYRSTDLDRSHPLAAMLADLHRDGSASRLALGGLDEDDVTAYVAEAGYDDVELARALASVTGGNPFFLIEALRHVAESGGRWDPSTLPQGVREAVSRRLSRLPAETNKALAAAAVVGSRFPLALVEQVVGEDLIDAFDEACKAGIVIEEPGGRYRFNHALVRQSLLAELASVRRMRLHQKIATTLEAESGADDELLAELAYHYFECAWAGNAAKAVEYCRRAADQAIERLAYEGAAELYDRALHALEELDDELPDRDALEAELLVARCEALLAAGDVGSAAGAVAQLRRAAGDSVRLSAWGTCFDGQLSMLTNPERLDEIESEVGAAAQRLAELDDAAGEANAHTVRAACLARLGRIADSETELDQALTAARRARDHRRVNAVLAGAPLAALWGPNPVPRAGGRCLDVVRLLRITTGSPVVEATSTRCQGVLDAMRGRAAAGRQLIDSARRTLTELGMRHALLEVDQFAGIVELVADDPAAAEPHLRRAYDGFRRMGLDADTAETAAFLARTCLVLDRDAEADELCRESERLAGHALRPSITWRTVRAQLHARAGAHDEARRVAGEAVSIAERTDALVDHGDACLTLAMVLAMAGDTVGSRAAAEQAVALFERKGAAALVERARQVLGRRVPATTPASQPSTVEPDNTCVRVLRRVDAALQRTAWDEFEHEYAPVGSIESRRKIVGFGPADYQPSEFASQARDFGGVMGAARLRRDVVAVRGERMALTRLVVGTTDTSPGAPQDEMLQLVGIDRTDRIVTQIWFDVDDIDAAITEMEAVHARFELEGAPLRGLENECVRVLNRVDAGVQNADWGEVEQRYAPRGSIESRRKIVGFDRVDYRPSEFASKTREFARGIRFGRFRRLILAVRGESLALSRVAVGTGDASPGAPQDEWLQVVGIDADRRIALQVWFDLEDMDAAIAELDAQHKRLGGEPERSHLENVASRAEERIDALFGDRRWDEIGELLVDDFRTDDRRRGLRRASTDRATEIKNLRAMSEIGVTQISTVPTAVRGNHLCLSRMRFQGLDAFDAEVLVVTEVNADSLLVARTAFDLDDMDAAVAELDARYLASEAEPHAHVWSVIVDTYAEFNRADYPSVVNIDHRKSVRYAPGELTTARMKDLMPNLRSYVEVVHRLTDAGVVVTGISSGTAAEGFEAEWRMVLLLTVDGDHLAWNELFDEADLETALRRFDELTRPKPQLGNSASRVNKHFDECFAARDWPAMAALLAEDMCNDDRRQVIGAGIRYGRDAEVANMQAIVDLGVMDATSEVVAVRGMRLALLRTRFSGRDRRPEAFHTDILDIVEIDGDGWIARRVAFDADDLNAALAELDARYLVGEAAPYAHSWSVVVGVFDALARHDVPVATADWVSIDHRRGTPLAQTDLKEIVTTLNELTPDLSNFVETVHVLRDHGALVTQVSRGTSAEGFAAEWRIVNLLTVDGDMVNRCELFDEADLDRALARFDELDSSSTTQLANAASRADGRFFAHFTARDWAALGETLADACLVDDRRSVVNVGSWNGRDDVVANLRALAEAGPSIALSVIAIRGQRLALSRIRSSRPDTRQWDVGSEMFHIVEIDTDERIIAHIELGPADLDAAFAELDARYISGEAAVNAHVWSVVAGAYAAFNRHELPPWTDDTVDIDHRSTTALAPGDLAPYLHATWFQTPDVRVDIVAVHRLTSFGAVVTHVAKGTTEQGFEGEWRKITLSIVEGDRISRSEMFDEADLDAALARFDELANPATRLENTASRVEARAQFLVAAGHWDAVAEVLADDVSIDDRRRVVNAGLRRGRDAVVEDLRVGAEIGLTHITPRAIAIRGERLTLGHIRYSADEERPEVGVIDLVQVIEIDADERITALVLFDADNLGAAVEELESRYVSGEGAALARTWSVIAENCAALNRQELPERAPGSVYVDRRRVANMWAADVSDYFRAAWELTPDMTTFVETVHRLSDVGAVVSQVAQGTSHDGFYAEWRVVNVYTVEDGLMSRCEVFDETDLDAALARFDELLRQPQPVENTASRTYQRFLSHFADRNWDAMAEMVAPDNRHDDRRRVVNAGIQLGRDAVIASMRAVADVGVTVIEADFIATRGERLALARQRVSGGRRPEAFGIEVLIIAEVGADNKVGGGVAFDIDDLDAAFEELDKRYMAGEAAAYAQTYSVIADAFVAVNRHELPTTTSDFASIDHRRPIAFAPGEMMVYLQATLNDAPEIRIDIETVHRLSSHGVVVSQVLRNTSGQGFDAEWRVITISTVEDGRINRCELFDDTELDAALARFDELCSPAPQLRNAASRVAERFRATFAARDWDAMAEMLAQDFYNEDRRSVVNAGIRHGRDSLLQDMRSAADAGIPTLCSTDLATRGERLLLVRAESSYEAQPGAFYVENIAIAEIDADGSVTAQVVFDVDDLDAAFQELDKRYIAGEAAAHAHTWSVIKDGYAALNRHEIPPTTPEWVNIDHRRGGSAFPPGELATYVRSSWVDSPQNRIHVEAVHRLNDLGAVVTSTTRGVSVTGFYAEWREVGLVMVDGEKLNRTELFDETDLDAALAKFDELSSSRFLENAAGRVLKLARTCFAARDWDGMRATLAEDFTLDDRRRTVNGGMRHGGDSMIRDARTATDVGITGVADEIMAVRGERLILTRTRYSESDDQAEAFFDEVLEVIEVNDAGKISMNIVFDPNDVDAAFAELDARYLAGEAAPYAQTWSAVAETHAAYNRNGLVPDDNWVSTDHRRGYPADQLNTTIRGARELTPDLSIYIESVHRLSDRAAVVTNRSVGSSHQGFVAEWRMIQLMTVDGDHVTSLEIFDETDLDAALARFDELTTRVPRIENATTRIWDRLADAFNRRDVDAFVDLTASDGHFADRRMGLRDSQGGAMRRRVVETLFEYPELWRLDVEHIAVRGSRLCLSRQTFRDFGDVDRPTCVEVLTLTESATDDLVHDFVLFDPDDIEPALAELDAKFVAGLDAACAHIWNLVSQTYAKFNRRQLSPTTPDWVNVDNRRGIVPEPGDMHEYVSAMWAVAPDVRTCIESVHRLTSLGAVFTHAEVGTSREGFNAEWRELTLLTFDGDLISRCELFDEDDIDAALARFDELSAAVPHLRNAATRTDARSADAFNRRDLDGYLAAFGAKAQYDDRRPGLRNAGPIDRELAHGMLFTGAPSWRVEVVPVAIRGRELALIRHICRDHGETERPVVAEVLALVEAKEDELISRSVLFDPDDIVGAFKELDARYLAGEAAQHRDTWHPVIQIYAGLNRYELPTWIRDVVHLDHRTVVTIDPNDLAETLHAAWDLVPDLTMYVETVHRLTGVGAVVTNRSYGTSKEGFDAEWRMIQVLTVARGRIDHFELFDEGDVDVALARLDELSTPTPRLDNMATRASAALADAFNRRDMDGLVALYGMNAKYDDRRKGLQHAGLLNRDFGTGLFELEATSSWQLNSEPVAIRGESLALIRHTYRDTADAERPITVEALLLTEADDAGLICHSVLFDPHDIDAAFDELDARYLAGEAAPYANIWRDVVGVRAAFIRRDVPSATAGWVNIDHRRGAGFAPGEMTAYLLAMWELSPRTSLNIENVHRLNGRGAVVTLTAQAASHDGFTAEWRVINLFTFEDHLLSRVEIFDESDVDAAVATFDNLNASAPQLENAAARARAHVCDAYNDRDLEGFRALAGGRYEDRRKGLRSEGAADRDFADAVLSGTPTSWRLEFEAVAIRGDRLALSRDTFRDTSENDLPITVDLIVLTDIVDELMPHTVFFDPDDIDAAFDELTARWIASGEVEHPEVIEATSRLYGTANCHDWEALATIEAGATYVNHRQLATGENIGDHLSSLRVMASLIPDMRVVASEIPDYSARGVVTDIVVSGTMAQGGAIELPAVIVLLFDGEHLTRMEAFDVDQRDQALARFEELNS